MRPAFMQPGHGGHRHRTNLLNIPLFRWVLDGKGNGLFLRFTMATPEKDNRLLTRR